MTSKPDHESPASGTPAADQDAPAAGTRSPARSVQEDPRARLALERKNQAANPAAATGAGHVKAAHESAKQGKQERKVRW